MKLNSLGRFSENIKYIISRKSGAELLDANRETDGQTDMTKLVVAFRNFANASKKKKIAEVGVRFEFHTTVPLKTEAIWDVP
jgi:hypothetical protein